MNRHWGYLQGSVAAAFHWLEFYTQEDLSRWGIRGFANLLEVAANELSILMILECEEATT